MTLLMISINIFPQKIIYLFIFERWKIDWRWWTGMNGSMINIRKFLQVDNRNPAAKQRPECNRLWIDWQDSLARRVASACSWLLLLSVKVEKRRNNKSGMNNGKSRWWLCQMIEIMMNMHAHKWQYVYGLRTDTLSRCLRCLRCLHHPNGIGYMKTMSWVCDVVTRIASRIFFLMSSIFCIFSL